MTRVSATLLAVGLALCPTAASAAPDGVRAYGRRMEALFVRMDANRDGRLDLHEVRGHPYLERRLLRRDSPGFLRMEHLRGPAGAPSGQRLQRRFRQADRNGDGRLDPQEVRRLPWLARHFQSLDLNQDGVLTLEELWMLQRALAPRPQP